MLERQDCLTGKTIEVSLDCGHLYVVLNYQDDKLFEVFINLGKTGGCARAQLEAISRLVSLGLRCGVDKKEIVDQLKEIRCPNQSVCKGNTYLSCADAVAKIIEKHS
jgi:ribonucleoside-diphosphate reductase alpha chain